MTMYRGAVHPIVSVHNLDNTHSEPNPAHIYTTGARLEQLEVVLRHPFLNLACAVMSTNCGNLIGGPTGVLLL